jgi:hypothetical protein
MVNGDPVKGNSCEAKEEGLVVVSNFVILWCQIVLTIAHIVHNNTRLRPILSTSIRFTQVKIKLVAAMVVPTATGFENPTREKRVDE